MPWTPGHICPNTPMKPPLIREVVVSVVAVVLFGGLPAGHAQTCWGSPAAGRTQGVVVNTGSVYCGSTCSNAYEQTDADWCNRYSGGSCSYGPAPPPPQLARSAVCKRDAGESCAGGGCCQGGQMCHVSSAADAGGFATLSHGGESWYLVRRAIGQSWHAATDSLQGIDEYGTFVNNAAAPDAFSVPFAQFDHTALMLMSGDGTLYARLPKTQLLNSWVADNPGQTTACPMIPSATSCSGSCSCTAGSLNVCFSCRQGCSSVHARDPLITDLTGEWPSHGVYAENSEPAAAGPTVHALSRGGSNVWVNQASNCVDCPAGQHRSAGTTSHNQCVACSVGQHQASPGQPSCDMCPVGQMQAETDQAACIQCAVGTSQPTAGQSSCVDCVAGRLQAQAGQSACNACGGGQYQNGAGQSSCIQCAVGTSQPTAGQGSCVDCVAGRFQAQAGQSACMRCDPGRASPAASTALADCIACAAGKRTGISNTGSQLENARVCLPCNPGRYSTSEGQTGECIICPAGTQSPLVANARTACEGCPVGTYSDSGPCIDCAAGQYGNSMAATTCILCVPGQHQPIAAQAECIGCAPGNYQNNTGRSSCTACLEGRHADATNTVSCIGCVAGKYIGTVGTVTAEQCQLCAAGRYTEITAASSCIACSAGSWRASASDASASDEQSDCIGCEAGKYLETAGSTLETDCTLCPEQRYSPTAGLAACIDCGLGRVRRHGSGPSASDEASDCIGCEPGRYFDLDIDNCTDCEVGQYSDEEGRTNCTFCSMGKCSFFSHDPRLSSVALWPDSHLKPLLFRCRHVPQHNRRRTGLELFSVQSGQVWRHRGGRCLHKLQRGQAPRWGWRFIVSKLRCGLRAAIGRSVELLGLPAWNLQRRN